ncbi:protein kinase domain-containing protein [Sorangium sp. So ce854]|uniref:serine/threonine-protein kinase n=1 Tax=Sorangium sp. So ce854 TaxID=3133322 RepID=UPI003F5FB036
MRECRWGEHSGRALVLCGVRFRAAPGWSIAECTDLSSVRCLHCGDHHDVATVVCPATGLVVEPSGAPSSRGGRRADAAPVDPPPRTAAPRPRPAAPSWRDAPAVRPRLTACVASGAGPRAGGSRPPSPSGAGLPMASWSRGDGAGATSLGRSLLGHVIGDKYGVTAIIGEGGMGAVYEAEHLQIGRLVAVKVMHARETQQREAISRLEHEARVAGRIGHPNICEVYDIGRLPDGSPYLVMERLHGETLAQRIERCGAVPPGELIDIMLQVLSALVTAHERGIVHRDLKPENIFLSERAGMLPVAKLLDFGISQASGVDGAAMDLTRTGMVMGTPYYMAPEQARGDLELDHRLDLWAVGVILYEALTGQRPFVAHNYNALLVQILTLWHRPVTELDPSIPPGLSRLVDRALAKEREERFQSAREFQEALRRFRNQSPQKRAPERLAMHSVVEDRSDDGTMMFARLAGDRGAGDPGEIVVARGRMPSEPARQGPRTSTSKGIQLRHSVWSSRALEAATGGGSARRRSEPAPDMAARRRSEPAPDMAARRRSEPAPDMAARRRSEPAPDMAARRRSEPAPDMAARRRSEPASEMRDGQPRDDEMEDRPTIPSLHPLARALEPSDDDAEATLVDPTPFPEDMTTLIRAEGAARDGDQS